MDKRLLDKTWRLNHLYWITNTSGERIQFKLNKAQKHFHENKHNRNIILKSRRLGFTTYEAIDSLDDTLFTPNFNALMLSYDVPSQLDIFDEKIIYAFNSLDELKSLWKLNSERANKLQFEHGGGELSSIQVRTKGRSGTFLRLHISELGKIAKDSPRKAKEILSGTIQAVPLNGRVDIESTAEGDVGVFFDMFWEAWERGVETPVDYKAHFYNWQWDEAELAKVTDTERVLPEEFVKIQELHNFTPTEITYYYYKWLTLKKDWDLLRQEYPITAMEAFVSSGSKLFSAEKLAQMPVTDGKKVGDWIYYADYIPGHTYALGADPSEGYGGDLASIVIIDFSNKEENSRRLLPKVVAEYANNKIQPSEFAYEIKNGGQQYGNCIAGVERNGPGVAVLGKLREIYFNIYSETRTDKWEQQLTEKLGWITNVATKPKMMYDLSGAINNDDILIPSKAINRELRTYNSEDVALVRFDPDQPSHWDRVIATAIAYQMASYAIPSQIKGLSKDEEDEQRENQEFEEDILEKYNVI